MAAFAGVAMVLNDVHERTRLLVATDAFKLGDLGAGLLVAAEDVPAVHLEIGEVADHGALAEADHAVAGVLAEQPDDHLNNRIGNTHIIPVITCRSYRGALH